jgi:hypothetical protein
MTRKEFLGFKEERFLFFLDGIVYTQRQWRQGKKGEGDVVVFMALMFLCCFLLFGMNEL